MIRLIAGLAAGLLAGCATVPSVNYHALGPGEHNDAWVPFRLTDSVVVVGTPAAAKADGGAAPPVDLGQAVVRCPVIPGSAPPAPVCGAVAVAAVPADFRPVVFGLEAHSRRLVTTTVTPTYATNSLRLKVLTVEAKDHRLEAINTIATIAVGAAKLAGGTNLSNPDPGDRTAQLLVPLTIALADLRCAGASCPTGPAALPRNPAWTYTLAYRDDPAAAGLLPRSAIETVHGAMVASACRPVRLTLHQADQNATIVLDTEVADPDWLVTVPFPAKGAMTFHTLCGIDVAAQPVTEIGFDAMATAFTNGVTQVAKQK